jgi:ABC-type transport system involved in Fe-S cluster assembly fused permease/ATPase subunit
MSLGTVPTTTELTPLISLQVLFNDTIKHNIKYGRLSAKDEEA